MVERVGILQAEPGLFRIRDPKASHARRSGGRAVA